MAQNSGLGVFKCRRLDRSKIEVNHGAHIVTTAPHAVTTRTTFPYKSISRKSRPPKVYRLQYHLIGLLAYFSAGIIAECQANRKGDFPAREGCAVKGMNF